MKKPKSIFCLGENGSSRIYNKAAIAELQELTENDGRIVTAQMILESPAKYADVEIILSGWGAPKMTEELLDALPSLKAFLYGAGSVRYIVDDAFWKRNILLTSAYKANAVPVAEYTTASIVFSLKKAWQHSRALHAGINPGATLQTPGVYIGSRVGIISLGAIGQLVCEKLSHFDIDVLAYDPFADDAVFEECAAKRIDDLKTLFSTCDVVSLHAPWLPETEGIITRDLLRSMPKGGTFINTSRGAIVDESSMIQVLQERSDLFAIIDVITDEPGYEKSPLATLPNVFLTPHIAGSTGNECHRMGAMVVEECRNFLSGLPPVTPVTQESIQRMA